MKALLVLVFASCAAAIPDLPSHGGPQWLELQSAHFTLWTDTSNDRAKELIDQMEHLHQVIFGVAFPDRTSRGRSFVVALRDQYEVNAYIPDTFQAISFPGDNPLRVPIIIFSAETSEKNGHVITHELTHVISHAAIADQPPWFAEGLAMFFETVTLDANNANVKVGEPLRNQVRSVQAMRLVPGDRLFACKELICRDAPFYMTSGLLFSYLANTHVDQLLKLEDELARGNPHAWDVVGIAPDDVDRLLREWTINGRHQVWTYKASLAKSRITQRTLADGDVVAMRGFLEFLFHDKVPAEDHALAADPTNVITRLTELARTKKISIADARATAAAHPDDWRAWWMVVFADPHDDEARTKACSLIGDDPSPRGLCPLDNVPGTLEHVDQPAVPQQVP